MNATELDRAFEQLEERVEALRGRVPDSALSQFDTLFSQSNDFYYGPDYQLWPINKVAAWEQRLPSITQGIGMAEQQAGPTVTVQTTPGGGKVHQFSPVSITGSPDKFPLWGKYAAGAVGLWLLWQIVFNKRK